MGPSEPGTPECPCSLPGARTSVSLHPVPLGPCCSPCLPALQPPEEPEDKPPETEDLLGVERTPSGRIRRTSAQVAVFHLQEIAEDELARDWTKRRVKDDLVPETARVSSRPRTGCDLVWGPLQRPRPCDLAHLLAFQVHICQLWGAQSGPWSRWGRLWPGIQ